MAQTVKPLPTVQQTWVQSLGREGLLEKGMAAHSSVLAWEIPWTEEPGGLQSMGSPRVGLTERLHFHFHHYLHYLHHSLAPENNREGTQLHPSTENWIKDLLNMVPTIRTRLSFPHSQSPHQEVSISLLSLSIRRQTE